MAREVITKLVDDLDGSEATATVYFSLDDRNYEIDLSDKNATALRKALDKYIQAARSAQRSESQRATRRRRSDGGKTRGRAASKNEREYDPREVREWAVSNSVEVPTRGRIPQDVVNKWREAMS